MRRLLLALALTTGCGGMESGLVPLGEDGLVPTPDLGDGAAYRAWTTPPADGAPEPVRTEVQVQVHATPAERVEDFALGPVPTPVADFLFVLDESVSMKKVMPKVWFGMATLTERGVFPTGSRIAVLHTMPADPDAPDLPHPAVPLAVAADPPPGFGALVSAPRIAAYKATAPRPHARRYRLAGCGPWFTPDEQGADGGSCLLAHTQIPLLPSQAEAGLVALRQWLAHAPPEERFRAGAAANVVFVSDTHDPGLAPLGGRATQALRADLAAERPDLAELEALVGDEVAAFRVHAIAPEQPCGEPWATPTYFEVAAAAGGQTEDVCTAHDYRDFIARVGQAGSRRQDPVLRLGYPAAEVHAVEVDGVPVGWHPTADPQAITLAGRLPRHLETVRVRYRPQG